MVDVDEERHWFGFTAPTRQLSPLFAHSARCLSAVATLAALARWPTTNLPKTNNNINTNTATTTTIITITTTITIAAPSSTSTSATTTMPTSS